MIEADALKTYLEDLSDISEEYQTGYKIAATMVNFELLLENLEDETVENFLDLSLKGEFLPKTLDFYANRKEILARILDFNLIAYARLISQNKIFDSEYVVNFLCQANKKKDCKVLHIIH